ncbi:MAG: SBBP repeat-containing protein [Bacteroidales bacterium]|nr:SBBP repeat-containing protein [Bacteroidales bacterium]
MFGKFCLIFGFSVFISFYVISAQEKKQSNAPYVRWVSEYPSEEKVPTKFSKRIGRVLFGKEDFVLSKPFNVLAKNPSEFWILDQGNGAIVKIKENTLETPKFIFKQLKEFSSLVGICMSKDGTIFFTDSHLKSVYKIDFNKKKILPINNTLELNQPTGIAYFPKNNQLWVVETGAHRILVLDADNGQLIKKIGGRGTANGAFNFPTFIWIDVKGNVYIVDSMNFRIQIFNSKGEFVSTFGQIGDASGYMARPKGIAVDSFGNIYIADALFHVVQVFDQAGNFLYRFGEQGHEKAQFWMPTGIYIDEKNYIYIADTYNTRIQIFQLVNGKLLNKE